MTNNMLAGEFERIAMLVDSNRTRERQHRRRVDPILDRVQHCLQHAVDQIDDFSLIIDGDRKGDEISVVVSFDADRLTGIVALIVAVRGDEITITPMKVPAGPLTMDVFQTRTISTENLNQDWIDKTLASILEDLRLP